MVASIGISLITPIQSIPEYARLTGQTVDAVRSQVSEGKLPTTYLHQGKRGKPFINMLALFLRAADSADIKLIPVKN